MNNRLTIVFVGLALLVAAIPALRGSETDPEALISSARDVALAPHFSQEAITKALVDVLTASLLVLPMTDYSEEFRSRIEGARKTLDKGELLSDKAYQDLGLAYKLVTGGKAWQLPEELKAPNREKGIDKAREICAKRLDSALAERKAGRNEQAVSCLLDFVILVVTPIEAERRP
jgi:hypothetical protein